MLCLFRLSTGTCVELKGTLVESPGKEQGKELQVNSINVLGECDGVSFITIITIKRGERKEVLFDYK